jgi:hypothetical protein
MIRRAILLPENPSLLKSPETLSSRDKCAPCIGWLEAH